MQGCKCSKGMSKSETVLQNLVKVDGEWAWNREGRAGLGIWSSENGIKG